MDRAVVQITLFSLLLALVSTLPSKGDWDIYSFHINSTVTSRYATTVITSRVANPKDESREIEFHVQIPKNAFITKFKMLIDGQEYDGVVKQKEQAQQQYHEAASRGQSAGIVSSVGRTLEEFKTSVNVAAHKKVTFELTYEELLKRRLGKYELQIHARPMQPVNDFKIDVHINEEAGINYLEVKGGLSTKELANAITKTQYDKQAWVYFYPTMDQQRTCDSCGDQGMNGDLVIFYDVNRDASGGHIMSSAGYFVHHFAPSNLTRIPKNVVFVIDQSGSMHGRKIEQTRIALVHILNDLEEDDYFGLITFDSNIFHWKRELVQANKANVDSAKTFAENIQDRGSTDINRAVLEGARMLNANPREGSASILILLTDGDPTTGVTNLQQIQTNVKRAIADKFPLYCLGFGFDVNFEFLEKMSLQNNGLARRIYEDSDADLQLTGFYEEVATPLLIDVTMIYRGGTNLTQTSFSHYYNGSEIVVAGQITNNDIETFNPQVLAISSNRRVVSIGANTTVTATETASDNKIQRVWAYLTVKQLLEKELQLSGPEKDNAKKEALRLSLKYSFVTPLTSMVVTKPLGENTDVLNKPKEGAAPPHTTRRISSQPPASWLPVVQGRYGQSGSARPGPPGPPGDGASAIVFRAGAGAAGGYGAGAVAGQGIAMPKTSSSHFKKTSTSGRGRVLDPVHSFFGGATGATGAGAGAGTGGGYGAGAVAGRGGGRVLDPVDGSLTQMDLLGQAPPMLNHDYTDYEDYAVYAAVTPKSSGSQVRATAFYVPPFHRFLLKMENQSLPLCFDVPEDVRLRLLHHPTRELTVNGELDSVANGGFKKIVIHLTNDQHIEIDTRGITVREGQISTRHTGPDPITVGSVRVLKRNKEIEIIAEDTRMVILIHRKNNKKFLWPALRLQPSDTTVTGILALKPEVYEKVQRTPSTKLRINNQEIDVTRSNAVDYSIGSPPTADCWLMAAESALQRPLDQFIVAQL